MMGFNFQTGTWTKRPIRKLGDEDRAEAERIARQVVDDPNHQRELTNWLLAKPQRLAQLRARQRDEERLRFELRGKAFTMTRTETLRRIVKDAGGIAGLCRRICKSGSAGDISEHELTGLIVTAAKAAQPDLSDAQAFTRMFADMTPAGEVLRKAITIAKAGPLPDDDDRSDDEDADAERDEARDDADDAMDELNVKAAALRKRLPHLTTEQAFERVYSAPQNVELRKRERRGNSPLRRVV
jgi:hypothetical protein